MADTEDRSFEFYEKGKESAAENTWPTEPASKAETDILIAFHSQMKKSFSLGPYLQAQPQLTTGWRVRQQENLPDNEKKTDEYTITGRAVFFARAVARSCEIS